MIRFLKELNTDKRLNNADPAFVAKLRTKKVCVLKQTGSIVSLVVRAYSKDI